MTLEYINWLQYHRFTLVGKRKEVSRRHYDAPWVDYSKVAEAMRECLQFVTTTKEPFGGGDTGLELELRLAEVDHQSVLKRVEILASLPAGEIGKQAVDDVTDEFHKFVDSALAEFDEVLTRSHYPNSGARALYSTRG